MTWLRKVAAVGVGALVAATGSADAQTTGKPIRLVIPFGAGSTTDLIGRVMAPGIGEALGQTIVIENKPGADGAIAGADVHRAEPDGSTLLLGTNSPLSVAPYLQKKIPYDPITGFSPISHLGYYTFFIVTNPSVPAKTVGELVTHLKANPGKLNYATGNTTSIVASALFAKQAGVEMVRVPYKTEPPAVTDLLTGQVQFMFCSYSTVIGQIEAKKVNVLAAMLPARSSLLPDVPAMPEVGFKDFPVVPWAAIVGPPGMKPELVERINKAVVAELAKPAIRKQLDQHAFAVKTSSPVELGEIIKKQRTEWEQLAKIAGLEPQ
jgi:tripartite-type tricarboxylate transporter receptor subunit TctC